MKNKTTRTCGNVFTDLGFDPAEAAVLKMRAALIIGVRVTFPADTK